MPLAFNELASDGFYIGLSTGVVKYAGYLDDDATYQMSYFSNELDFGNPGITKFLKKFHITVIGGSNAKSTLNWTYDYSDNFSKQQFEFESSGITGEYNVSEFNTTAEFTGGVDIQTPKVNTTGSGSVVKIGVVSTINNFAFALQKIDILAKIGRLV